MKFKNRVGKAFSEGSCDTSLFERGIAGTAVVNSVKRSVWSKGQDDDSTARIYKFSLTVTVPGREPYDVDHSETVSAKEGQTVNVKVDPDDPENLLIDRGSITAETTKKWAEQAQATLASVQQMQQQVAPTAVDANDPALEPIAGISLERYAELKAAQVKAGIATEEQQGPWLTTQGVKPSDWKAAADGWAQRMTAQPALSMRFAALYQRATS